MESFDPTQMDATPVDDWDLPLEEDVSGWDIQPPEHDAAVDDILESVPTGQTVVLQDLDMSGRWDVLALDLDGDGVPELVLTPEGDGYLVAVDTTGDGSLDHAELLTADELAAEVPELAEYFATAPLQLEPMPEVDTEGSGTATPTEVLDSEYWFLQSAPGLCVPASIAQIVAAYTGFGFDDEAAFVALANELGLFAVGMDGIGGMYPTQALYLLEAAGVPASLVVSSSIDMLETYLDDGHGVVLFVDSGQVWEGVPNGVMDHALVITEIDRESGYVVLSDPGHPEGNGLVLTIEDFEQAWAAGDNQMLIAEEPAPDRAEVAAPSPASAPHPVPVGSGDGLQPASGPTPSAADASQPNPLLDILEQARAEDPIGSQDPLVLDRLTSPDTHLQQVMNFVMRRPYILLPIAIAATQLRSK